MQHFADRSSPIDADLAMDAEELRAYLRNMDYDSFYPTRGVLAQTEAIGDPALPTTQQRAILSWLDAAMQDWDQSFPLEEPLAAELRRLRPLIAAQALTETRFLTPGAHPLHQLLDAVQVYAVGWQARLGRVGRAMEDEIRGAISDCLVWFDVPETDLSLISARIVASATKASARAHKMTQRLIETELGRIRVVQSKHHAALMINAALEKYRAPRDIGDFLKGPWYDSAQLLLMKFGEKSAEWKHMSLTTIRLLESLQNPIEQEEGGVDVRQRTFVLLAQLPKELVRWLLSLQHDGEAVGEAVDQIRELHSQVLHGSSLDLEKISPLPLQSNLAAELGSDENLDRFLEGQWFILNIDDNPPLRAMLALRLEDERQLLFANQAGIKVLKKSFSEFEQLVAAGRVTTLDAGASFSRCLARSVGVETQNDLDELTGVAAKRARRKLQQQQKAERESLRLERQKAKLERLEEERQLQEQQEIENEQREMAEAEQERLHLRCELEETKRLQLKWEELTRRVYDGVEVERQQAGRGHAGGADKPADGPGLSIPRCTWLGFRDGDGDDVVLARLAVHDRELNNYIFVDRHGMKVRQLSSSELRLILSRGLMDILEARSRFRDEVVLAQEAERAQAE
tara:strand:- start:420499 stop:422385 length:1887 start_codon:yes stop_codon:yes gene_type:complete